MPRYARPETGACDAMASCYGKDSPCTRKAIWRINGHDLCERHAQMSALLRASIDGSAVRLPGTRCDGMRYVPGSQEHQI